MATGGGKPGIKTKVTVVERDFERITFALHPSTDANYFKVGDEFLAEFHAIALDDSSSGSGEQRNG